MTPPAAVAVPCGVSAVQRQWQPRGQTRFHHAPRLPSHGISGRGAAPPRPFKLNSQFGTPPPPLFTPPLQSSQRWPFARASTHLPAGSVGGPPRPTQQIAAPRPLPPPLGVAPRQRDVPLHAIASRFGGGGGGWAAHQRAPPTQAPPPTGWISAVVGARPTAPQWRHPPVAAPARWLVRTRPGPPGHRRALCNAWWSGQATQLGGQGGAGPAGQGGHPVVERWGGSGRPRRRTPPGCRRGGRGAAWAGLCAGHCDAGRLATSSGHGRGRGGGSPLHWGTEGAADPHAARCRAGCPRPRARHPGRPRRSPPSHGGRRYPLPRSRVGSVAVRAGSSRGGRRDGGRCRPLTGLLPAPSPPPPALTSRRAPPFTLPPRSRRCVRGGGHAALGEAAVRGRHPNTGMRRVGGSGLQSPPQCRVAPPEVG